jgi:nitroimidazol reductase NimA-like FMN-containing flavoprotein (pyridoxamine 5'-phosphate oxidase superfamily)/GNAT superfamily N-acetyltransferase
MREIRRKEHAEHDPAVLREILDRARFGHLATTGADGIPVVKPMNYVRLGEQLYFHSARQGERSEHLDRPACFVTEDVLCWIPSTWRNPVLACPATTFYRSVLVQATPRVIEDAAEKARALQAFMERYQPEGGYRPITATDPLYRGPVAGVLVFGLELAGARCKVKTGQNLDRKARRAVLEQLLARNGPGDYRAARILTEQDPDLAPELRLYPRQEAGFHFVDELEKIPVGTVGALLRDTYWATGRSDDVVRRSLEGSLLVLGAFSGGELVGFARVVSDGAVAAWVHDVVVHPGWRGQGLGRHLMRLLLEHPRLASLPRLFLNTRTADFYAPLGFVPVTAYTADCGPVTMMVHRRPVHGDFTAISQ